MLVGINQTYSKGKSHVDILNVRASQPTASAFKQGNSILLFNPFQMSAGLFILMR